MPRSADLTVASAEPLNPITLSPKIITTIAEHSLNQSKAEKQCVIIEGSVYNSEPLTSWQANDARNEALVKSHPNGSSETNPTRKGAQGTTRIRHSTI